jgi:dihydrofolate reductase
MSATVLYMSMSVDGFIAGPNERIDNGLGDGGLRLHEWPWTEGVNAQVLDEFMATGAVVAGRGTEIHLVPVLLGQGRRLFDNLSPEHIELERTRVLEGPGVTHLHYRVRRT